MRWKRSDLRATAFVAMAQVHPALSSSGHSNQNEQTEASSYVQRPLGEQQCDSKVAPALSAAPSALLL